VIGRTLRGIGLALVVVTVSWLTWRLLPPRARRSLHGVARPAGAELRYWGGRFRGVGYHLVGRHPDPDVSDMVLANRVRSSLGPLEKRLDMPRVRVSVEGHIAELHGDVPSRRSAKLVERAVLRTAGVRGVESYLQVAPISAGERPSGGGVHPGASPAYKRLVDAAFNAGAPAEVAPRVVRAVLGFLADRIPAREFDQLVSHLPVDVRAQCVAPARRGAHPRRVRKVEELVAGLATATEPLPPDQAEHVIESVLGALRDLVPEEDRDIAAVLPEELQDFWLSATPH
jgi:uncharacterized protein (DUF2267 family)